MNIDPRTLSEREREELIKKAKEIKDGLEKQIKDESSEMKD